MIAEIRAKARELLADKRISCFIGYEEGTRGKARPAFIYDAAEADRLIWDERCTHNLAVYLHQFKRPTGREASPPRVGVLVKPCDSRSLNVLLHEEQIDRAMVHIVGVTCEGLRENGQLLERCQRCEERTPLLYDTQIGEKPAEVGRKDYADVVELEHMSPAERLAFWTQAFDRCIRCYACRQACPVCYCPECVAEQLAPTWMNIAIDLPQKRFFHVMRAYHLAGRCSGCNACEEACPMDIPLSLLHRKIAKEVEALFGYVSGQDAETPPPLATFQKEEKLPL
ncbi:MAG: 4Fe-4S dicluster domain-containing protein [Chloroflexi bacterium]|nr:4Fe-4S dicluster domain-containing protein [Chloroflexota bacterium]